MKAACTAIIISTILFSCTKDKNNSPGPLPAPMQLTAYPMAIGNNWKYYTETQLIDSNGITILEQKYDNYWEVISDTTVNGISCTKIFQTDSMYGGMMHMAFTYYENKPDGFYAIAVDGSGSLFQMRKKTPAQQLFSFGITGISSADTVFVPDTALKLLQFPITISDEWFSHEWNYPLVHLTTRKWIGYQTVTTPAGTFNCIKLQIIRNNIPDYIVYQYFSDKGLIMEERFANNLTTSSGEILSSHFIAKLINTNF